MSTATYCARSDMEAIFGTLNINRWANLEGDASTTTITTRITRVIGLASQEIEDLLRDRRYTFPLTQSATLTDLVAKIAGIHLHDSRGVIDGTGVDQVSAIRAEVNLKIQQIRNGTVFLDGDRRTNAPGIVSASESSSSSSTFDPFAPYFGYKQP